MKVWNYNLPSTEAREGWAYIVIREDGFFATVSDFGDYAYLWSHHGCDDARKFFIRDNWEYIARKLKPEEHIHAEKSFNAVFRDIIEDRRDGRLSKEAARERWEHVKYYTGDDDWEGFIRDDATHGYFDEPWCFAVAELDPMVVRFAKETMPRLAELIRAELKREAREKQVQARLLRHMLAMRRRGF